MDIYYYSLAAWSVLAILVLLILLFSKLIAPYGRHNQIKSKWSIANHWGWFWMELPAFLLCPLLTLVGPTEKTPFLYLLIA